jgi:transcriptional regulator of arginine metabolism
MKPLKSVVDALHELLVECEASTQEDICKILEQQGYEINQSKVSRLLKKLGAIKVVRAKGSAVYSLPREIAPPAIDTPLRNLIVDIAANEALVVIFTSPGSASMVARMLDHFQMETEILGTIAGDDTIFVAPKSTKETAKLFHEIKRFFIGQ